MKKNLMIKKMVVLLFIATVFFLTGCETDSRVTYLNLRPAGDNVLAYIEEMEAWGTEMAALHSFGVAAQDLELGETDNFYGVIELSDINDVLVAQVESISTHDFHLVLKVFLNYNEVPFRVNGEESYATEFIFLLEQGYAVDIPFTIDSFYLEHHTTSKLTVGIFSDPLREVINENNHDVFQGRSGLVLNQDLIIGTGGEIQFEAPDVTAIINREEDEQFVDLWIAPDFSLNEYGFLGHPDLHMQVEQGEEINLLFYASPFAAVGYELENYLILGMINWQQVPLNGQPFLWVDTLEHGLEHVSDHGRLTLPAIDEVGYHDFTAILIANPEKENSLANSFPLLISNRLVIEVVE